MGVNRKSKEKEVLNVKKVCEKDANPQVKGRLVFTTSYLSSYILFFSFLLSLFLAGS